MNEKFVTLNVYPDRSRGRIDPNIYGLHREHIWNCVYPGVWGGPEHFRLIRPRFLRFGLKRRQEEQDENASSFADTAGPFSERSVLG